MKYFFLLLFPVFLSCQKESINNNLIGVWHLMYSEKENIEIEDIKFDSEYIVIGYGDMRKKYKYETDGDIIIYYNYQALGWRKFARFRLVADILVLDQGAKSIFKKQ